MTTTNIGRRQRVLDLPEAGKPEGTCPECGPHGNRGWVDLSVWRRHIVPCLTCSARAEAIAWATAHEHEFVFTEEVRAEGCEPVEIDVVSKVEPLGDNPRARRVTVVVPYRHARKDALTDLKAQVDASRAAVAASSAAVTAAQQALASRMRTILGVP